MSIATDATLLYGIKLTSSDEPDECLQPLADWLGVEPSSSDGDFRDIEGPINDALPEPLQLYLGGHADGARDWFITSDKLTTTAYRGHPCRLRKLTAPNKSEVRALTSLGKKLGLKPEYWLVSYSDF